MSISLKRNLQAGESFHFVLQQLGFKQEQLVQVELAEVHGNLVETLKGIAEQFQLIEQFRRDLKRSSAIHWYCWSF